MAQELLCGSPGVVGRLRGVVLLAPALGAEYAHKQCAAATAAAAVPAAVPAAASRSSWWSFPWAFLTPTSSSSAGSSSSTTSNSNSSSSSSQGLAGGSPPALLVLQGTADPTLPFAPNSIQNVSMLGAEQTAAFWASHLGCKRTLGAAASPDATSAIPALPAVIGDKPMQCKGFCSANSSGGGGGSGSGSAAAVRRDTVAMCAVQGGDHMVFDFGRPFAMTELMWDFFKRL